MNKQQNNDGLFGWNQYYVILHIRRLKTFYKYGNVEIQTYSETTQEYPKMNFKLCQQIRTLHTKTK